MRERERERGGNLKPQILTIETDKIRKPPPGPSSEYLNSFFSITFRLASASFICEADALLSNSVIRF